MANEAISLAELETLGRPRLHRVWNSPDLRSRATSGHEGEMRFRDGGLFGTAKSEAATGAEVLVGRAVNAHSCFFAKQFSKLNDIFSHQCSQLACPV